LKIRINKKAAVNAYGNFSAIRRFRWLAKKIYNKLRFVSNPLKVFVKRNFLRRQQPDRWKYDKSEWWQIK
jgi:hypothetical protein